MLETTSHRIRIPNTHVATLFLATCFSCISWASASAEVRQTDVCVYGATPAGIAASIAAEEMGCSVLLVDPTTRIGGLTSSGLSHPDIRTFAAQSGFYEELCDRVEEYYRQHYGPDSDQLDDCFRGTHAEPKVFLEIFHAMLDEHPGIHLLQAARLQPASVKKSRNNRIQQATFAQSQGTEEVHAAVFIDATYEGDLMAAAGVAYHVGSESRATYNEGLAPPVGSNRIQGYNFRFCATNVASNRAPVVAPEGYDRNDFVAILDLIAAGQIVDAFGTSTRCIFKEHVPALPNGKNDINDMSRGVVRLSMPGRNLEWPEGDWEVRQRIMDEHLYFSTGLLYFLQNDEAVPADIRERASRWGWCQDEFLETDHLPPMIYVREARRMQGQYIFTQHDLGHASGDSRAIYQPHSVAFCDYGVNSHGTGHKGPIIGGVRTGEIGGSEHSSPPYQIPYETLLPRNCGNLLVPVALSASHVGFAAIRFEPTWMSLGQAAGYAAALAYRQQCDTHQVDIQQLQYGLHSKGLATIYVSDVPPSHPDFAAVQWWGTRGGLHGLEPRHGSAKLGTHLKGPYHTAYLHHEAKLDQPLTPELRETWLALLQRLGGDPSDVRGAKIRGEFIRSAWQSLKTQSQAKRSLTNKSRRRLSRAEESGVSLEESSMSEEPQ